MLGYIRPYKPELKLKEYEVYRGVYCGLCKELGKAYGPFARLTLSYDFAFLSLLGMAVNGKQAAFELQRCGANPFKKKNICTNSGDMEFTAAVAMLMIYYKLEDNFYDKGMRDKLISCGAYPFIKHSQKRSALLLPHIDEIIRTTTQSQHRLEDAGCTSVDEASEPTATAMELIAASLCDDETQKRVLARFGYLLGRWVYLIDALDDIEDDIAKGNYNPFIMKHSLTKGDKAAVDKVRQEARPTLYMTVAEIAKTYELLDISFYQPILDNIIYLGLKDSVDKLYLKADQREEENHDGSI